MALVFYMVICTLFTEEYLRIQLDRARFRRHLMGCLACAAAGVGLWFVGEEWQFQALYLAMPLLFLLLLIGAGAMSNRLHQRPLIRAYKGNMGSEEASEAEPFDYVAFLVIHIVPLIVPPFIMETILGRPI